LVPLAAAALLRSGIPAEEARRLPGPLSTRRLRAEAIIMAAPDAASFSRHLLHLAEEPHRTGTPRDLELAEYVRARFLEYGLDEARFHDTPALLSSPASAAVEILSPVKKRLKLAEDPVPGDKDSHLYGHPRQVPYHAYAADGDVRAAVVYANGGSPEDFARLEEMGIDVHGTIVIMRYSEPYSYRGYKVFQAEARGALGTILYSDPQDDGFARGDVYPEGPWGPASHIQWGSILYDWLGPGEPFSFHWTKKSGAWVEGPRRDRQLPKIPSVPMSHEDAAEILSRLRGPAVPSGWQGGLPFTYHVGPGPVTIRLQVDNTERIGTIRNVIGVIRGAQDPDRLLVIGNHRDAWIYGAVDPSSGTAALLEVARALGGALRQGFRPRRTILLANWSAEEELLGGSTQWAKDNRERLLRDGVAYVNVDHSALGPRFDGGATPELAEFLRDAARAVADPSSGGSLFSAWAARSSDGVPEVEVIVGATDYTVFLEHLGMACIDMSFGGPYGVYHSQYDNYAWLSRVGDPGFHYNTSLARLWGVVAWRLADAELLPMRFSDYARAPPPYFDAIEGRAGTLRPVRLEASRAAARDWQEAAAAFESALDRRLASGDSLPDRVAWRVNDLLLKTSRAMTDPEGLQGRPFFKHLIFAPQPTYRPEFLPRLHEAIERGEAAEIPRHEAQLAAALGRAAGLMRQAGAAVSEGGGPGDR
jgi:N-acetylated-alpha-linked acidic dipeptidase